MASKIVDLAASILLFTGMFLAFLPHALHVSIGLNDETSHLKHIFSGIIVVVIALGILIYNNRAFRLKQKHLYSKIKQ